MEFSPTSCSDGGGAQHIRRKKLPPIRLVFWVEKGPKTLYVVAPLDLGPVGAQAHGNEPGRLQASSKIINSVVTIGSNTFKILLLQVPYIII